MDTLEQQRKAYSVSEFCHLIGIGRATFYKLKKEGRAPTIFKVGRRTLISDSAINIWCSKMEEESLTLGIDQK